MYMQDREVIRKSGPGKTFQLVNLDGGSGKSLYTVDGGLCHHEPARVAVTHPDVIQGQLLPLRSGVRVRNACAPAALAKFVSRLQKPGPGLGVMAGKTSGKPAWVWQM